MIRVITDETYLFPIYISFHNVEYFKRKGIKYWLYILKNRKYIVSIEKEKV